MRKFGLFLLLASCAMPALAQRDDDDDRQSRRTARAEQAESRPQRVERSERREARELSQRPAEVERHHAARRGDDAAVPVMRERGQEAQQQGEEQGRAQRVERLQRYQHQQVQDDAARSERPPYRQRQFEREQQAQGGGLVPRQSRIRTIPTTEPVVGQQGPVRQDIRVVTPHGRYDRNHWTNQWRNDRRYDWRRFRDRNRSVFRIGFYYDPFGYGYSRFGIGSYLYSNYYQSNYWINDPWQYRLPPAYGPYRWIRYHDDAILIDTWTGEVVDVIYSFFW